MKDGRSRTTFFENTRDYLGSCNIGEMESRIISNWPDTTNK